MNYVSFLYSCANQEERFKLCLRAKFNRADSDSSLTLTSPKARRRKEIMMDMMNSLSNVWCFFHIGKYIKKKSFIAVLFLSGIFDRLYRTSGQ